MLDFNLDLINKEMDKATKKFDDILTTSYQELQEDIDKFNIEKDEIDSNKNLTVEGKRNTKTELSNKYYNANIEKANRLEKEVKEIFNELIKKVEFESNSDYNVRKGKEYEFKIGIDLEREQYDLYYVSSILNLVDLETEESNKIILELLDKFYNNFRIVNLITLKINSLVDKGFSFIKVRNKLDEVNFDYVAKAKQMKNDAISKFMNTDYPSKWQPINLKESFKIGSNFYGFSGWN